MTPSISSLAQTGQISHTNASYRAARLAAKNVWMSDKSWEPGMSCKTCKTHSFNLSFTHSLHAEQLLFSCLCSKVTVYSWKLQCFFGTSVSYREFRVHRACSQLKTLQAHLALCWKILTTMAMILGVWDLWPIQMNVTASVYGKRVVNSGHLFQAMGIACLRLQIQNKKYYRTGLLVLSVSKVKNV